MELYYERSRCFFVPFNSANDCNPQTKRAGIASYKPSGILYFLAKLFQRVVTLTDAKGIVHYLNKGSLRKWTKRHGEELTDFDQKIFSLALQRIVSKMTSREIQGIDTQHMTQAQIDATLNQYPVLVEKLSRKQLLNVIKWLHPETLKFLKPAQIKELNNPSYLHLLSVTQIHSILHCLEYKHFKLLTEQQRNDLIPLLTNEDIQKYYQKFPDDMFNGLSDAQFQSMMPYIDLNNLSSDHLWTFFNSPARFQALTPKLVNDFFQYFYRRAFVSLSTEDKKLTIIFFKEYFLKAFTNDQLIGIDITTLPNSFKVLINFEKQKRNL